MQSRSSSLVKTAVKSRFGRGTVAASVVSHDGLDLCRRNRRVFRHRARLCMGVYPPVSTWELVMGSIMAVGLTAYLVYAMLRPEKF